MTNIQSVQMSSRTNLTLIHTICIQLFLPSINYYLVALNLPFQVAKLSYFLIFGSSILSLILLLRKKARSIVAVYFLASTFVIWSYLKNPNLGYWIYRSPFDVSNGIYILGLVCLPMLLFMNCDLDPKRLYKTLVPYSRTTAALSFFVYAYVVLYKGELLIGMSVAYLVVPSTIICFYDRFFHHKKWSGFFFLIGLCTILLNGSRGAALTLICFVFLYAMFVGGRRLSPRKMLFITVLALIAFLIYMNFDFLISRLNDYFLKIDVENRIIAKLAGGEFFDDNGRQRISDSVMQAIRENPFGNGMWGDRFWNLMNIGTVSYSHNLELELLCQFGIFLGTGMIVVLFYSILTNLRQPAYDDVYYLLFLMSVSLVLIKLQFSSSYLDEPSLFILIGLLYRYHKQKRSRLKVLYDKSGQLKPVYDKE